MFSTTNGCVSSRSQIRIMPEALRYRFQNLERASIVLEVGTHSP